MFKGNNRNTRTKCEICSKLTIISNGTMELLKTFPTRRLKHVSDVCSPVLANIWNEEILLNKIFPENLNLADVAPISKKKDKTC